MRHIMFAAAACVAFVVSLASPTAHAVNVATDGVGEVAIIPYYTAREGWQTLISMTNTQRQPIVAKVRVRESRNSRVVLDFLVALAGYDVFTGVIREASDGSGPVFIGTDSPDEHGAITCTIPSDIVLNRQLDSLVNLDANNVIDLNGLVVNNVSLGDDAFLLGNVLNYVFQDGVRNTTGAHLKAEGYASVDSLGVNQDGGSVDIDRAREGYVEIIVLGYAQLPDALLEYPVGIPSRIIPTELNETLNELTSLITDNIISDSVNDIVSDVSGVPLGVINVATAIEHRHCGLLDYAFYDYDNPLTPLIDLDDVEAGLQGQLDAWLGLLTGTPALGFAPSYALETARQMGEPINALKVNYSLLNPSKGIEASMAAPTWANFYNPDPAGRVTPDDNADCLITRGDERADVDAESGVVGGLLEVVGGLLFCPDGSPSFFGLNCEAVPVEWSPDGGVDGESCRNLITAQRPFDERQPPLLTVLTGVEQLGALQTFLVGENGPESFDFLEPSLNDAYPAVANWFSDELNASRSVAPLRETGLAAPENVRGVDAFSMTIQRQAIFGEYSVNPALGVETNWIVTLPTKHFYVDDGLDLDDAATVDIDESLPGRYVAILPEDGRDEAVLVENGVSLAPPYAPFQNAYAQTVSGDPSTAESCSGASFVVFDRAAQTVQPAPVNDVVISPAPPVTRDLTEVCNEANVFTFNGQGSVLAPSNPVDVTVDTDALSGNTSGWMFMLLDEDPAADGSELGGGLLGAYELPGGAGLQAVQYSGLPVLGIQIKTRTFGTVTRNFATMTESSYIQQGVNVP